MSQNELLLNPRLPELERNAYLDAWRKHVEPSFSSHIGIATSGTSGSGFGKLILLSSAALEVSARAVNERFESDEKDVWFKSLPDFHVGGLGILIRARLSGAAVVEDASRKWNAREFFDQVTASQATLISLVPTQVFDLVSAGIKAPRSVRAVIVGGGNFESSLREKAIALGWPCLASYGMTETCSQIATALTQDDPSLILLTHAKARTSPTGRIEVSGDSLLSAQIIFTQGAGGIESSLADPKIDGWFVSEDRGIVTVDRRLIVEGRASDYVKIGGEGVSLSALDEKLERLKLALRYRGDAAILAAHDERLGAVLILVANQDTDTAKLVAEFNAQVLPFERIRKTEVVVEIPRSPLGKLLRARALELVGLKALAND